MEVEFGGSFKAEADKHLVEAVKAGEEAAFTTLVSKYKRAVYFTILKMVKNTNDAQDLSQETFTKAYANIHKFDSRFAFSTWLFRIATNTCIDHIRKRKIILQSISSYIDTEDGAISMEIHDPNSPIPDITLSIKERNEFINRAVDKLPAKFQEIVRLRYFLEYSYEEISAHLKIPLGTVKAKLHRAKITLNEILADYDNFV
ncbi:MAG: sigma-70 family RNA polymerase sigma factor [Bacteroidia bacterium]|nr:sigma-70 family RNA polymerase sigma factor [Bacteroidia bacterium]